MHKVSDRDHSGKSTNVSIKCLDDITEYIGLWAGKG
jgi:hypothetical protein